MTRHLIYHCCPLRDNDLWLRNVEQLCARARVFDGRRYVAVSTGDPARLWPVDRVKDEMKALLREFDGGPMPVLVPVPNDRRLREVASFRGLLERVVGPTHDQHVFYAHTKGNSTYDSVTGATYWRNGMYSELLDRWERCCALLEEGYSAVGCSKICWPKGHRSPYPSRLEHGNNWMFAGTFFWFDAAKINARAWREIPSDRYGAEAWLCGMFRAEECKSVMQLWPEEKSFGVNPYDPELYIKAGMAIPDAELRQPAYCI